MQNKTMTHVICSEKLCPDLEMRPHSGLFPQTLVVMVSWVMMTATGLEYLDSFLVLDSSTTSS